MVSDYLESHGDLEITSTTRRTRLSTKKLIGTLRFKLKDIKNIGRETIANYRLDGRIHQVVFDEDTILKVSCTDCSGNYHEIELLVIC
jgi:hypothetical protein